jgi:hypothetical protein
MDLTNPTMMAPANATGAPATPGVSPPPGCWIDVLTSLAGQRANARRIQRAPAANALARLQFWMGNAVEPPDLEGSL